MFCPQRLSEAERTDEEERKGFLQPPPPEEPRAFRVRQAFWASLGLVLSSMAVGFLIGKAVTAASGAVSSAIVTSLQIIGATLLLWGTLFVRGWDIQSFGGVTLTERVNRWIYRSLYWLGTSVIVASLTVTAWPGSVSRSRAWNPRAITAQFADMYVNTGQHLTGTFHYTLENHTQHDYQLPGESALYRVLAGGKGLQRDKTLKWVSISPVPLGQRINVGIQLEFEYTEGYPYTDRDNPQKLNSFMKRRLEELDGFMALDEANRYEIRFPKPPGPKG